MNPRSKPKRSTPQAQPKRRRLDRRLKNRLYETIYDLNRGFAVVLETFERLERQAFFRGDYLRAFRNMADELRAKTNYELTATLRDREQREAAEFGRLCRKWEKRFQAPERVRLKLPRDGHRKPPLAGKTKMEKHDS
jgi:hypothetical protein